jgi:hypothetical protein
MNDNYLFAEVAEKNTGLETTQFNDNKTITDMTLKSLLTDGFNTAFGMHRQRMLEM